jgi:hypothetical protein
LEVTFSPTFDHAVSKVIDRPVGLYPKHATATCGLDESVVVGPTDGARVDDWPLTALLSNGEVADPEMVRAAMSRFPVSADVVSVMESPESI